MPLFAFEHCWVDQLRAAAPAGALSTRYLARSLWDADENMVSCIVQDPASRLSYRIIICLFGRGRKYPLLEANCLMVCVVIQDDYISLKAAIDFSCKVAAPLCWSYRKMHVLVVLW